MDLDEDINPNWNAGNGPLGSSAGYGLDINLDATYRKVGILRDAAKESGPASYATCAAETAYSTGGLSLSKVKSGDEICLRTNQGRYALVIIKSASVDELSFTATVWDPPA